jgi:signal recognition particle receptor subunit beta
VPNLIPTRKQISVRIVYVGPGVGGKTTNLRQIHQQFPEFRMAELATEGDRTLGGDFLPVALGAESIDGWELKVSLSSVPGQIQYAESRASVLKNADVLVFVADSHPLRKDANLHAFHDVRALLEAEGRDPTQVPIVFQFNKSDLPGATSAADLQATLNQGGAPAVEGAVAKDGVGVFETLGEALTLGIEEARRYLKQALPARSTAAV